MFTETTKFRTTLKRILKKKTHLGMHLYVFEFNLNFKQACISETPQRNLEPILAVSRKSVSQGLKLYIVNS